MLLSELFENESLEETARMVWARKGNEVKKKFRCTSGHKQGQLVNNPADCGTGKDMKKSQKMRTLYKQQGKKMKKKAQRTQKKNPASQRLRKLNKSLRK